jgi:hypothetical protein
MCNTASSLLFVKTPVLAFNMQTREGRLTFNSLRQRGDNPKEKLFHFGASPGSFSEELQAGFNAGVVIEAADFDDAAQLGPPVMSDQFGEYRFQGDAVEGIIGMRVGHGERL